MKQCMSVFGYDVKFLDDGGISIDVADESAPPEEKAKLGDQADKREQECLHKTGFDRVAKMDPKTDWEQQTKVDDCIRAEGYPIKSPTFEEFQRGIVSDRVDLLPKDPDVRTALQKKCGF